MHALTSRKTIFTRFNTVTCKAFPTPAPMRDRIIVTSPVINFAFEPFYRVILLYTNWDNDKPVAKLVSASVPIITNRDAANIVKTCRIEGTAIVVTVLKDDAVLYMTNIKNKGLDCMIDEA